LEKIVSHHATGRVLDVLELLAASNEGYTFTELCNAIKAPKSSMFPIIHTLRERNFLVLNEVTLKYNIGSMAFQVGNAFLNNFDIMKKIRDEMQDIVDICSETCHFATLTGGDVLYLDKIDSPEPIRMFSSVGNRIHAYGTGLGKALLIDYSLSELKKLYPDGLRSITKKTITDFQILEDQLQEARINGITYEVEESNKYICCVALPIRKANKVIAALSVAIPTFRYTEEKKERAKQLLFNAKAKIENLLKIVPVDFNSRI
jgi:IclR family KDG regulon transcriptional repressor